jgi:RND family efflux transporter MFP subunit
LEVLKASDPSPQVVIADVNVERAQLSLEDAQEVHDAAVARWWEKEEIREGTARGVHMAELSLKVAEANYQQALQDLEAHKYNVQIQEQEVALARMRLEKLKAGLDVEEMRLTVERLKAQLSDARLTAPFDGQILLVRVTEGRMVEAYNPVMVVGDPSELEVSAELSGSQMQDLVEDMPVVCTLTSRPGEEIPGHIRRLPYPYGSGGSVSSSLEEEDESTRITLEALEDIELGLGDLMHVAVVLESKEDVLWLPPQAIRTFEGRKFVVIQEGEGQRRVDVKIGIESEDRVEIEEGLSQGQIVIGQ